MKVTQARLVVFAVSFSCAVEVGGQAIKNSYHECSSRLSEALPPGAGCSCDFVTVVGFPSSHTSFVARALGVASTGKNVTILTGLARDVIHNDSGDGGGRGKDGCFVVTLRDFKEVLCSAARSQGCAGCSAVAMETKMRHWVHRLFHDERHDQWSTWLPKMVDLAAETPPAGCALGPAAAALLKLECFAGCPSESLEGAFRDWLGVPSAPSSATTDFPRGDASSLPNRILETPPNASSPARIYGARNWRSCFTEKTLAHVTQNLGFLMTQVGYSPTEDGTCAAGDMVPASSPDSPVPALAATTSTLALALPGPPAAPFAFPATPSHASPPTTLLPFASASGAAPPHHLLAAAPSDLSSPSSSTSEAPSPRSAAAQRLARFKARYPRLRVVGVDGRYHKKILARAGAASHQKRSASRPLPRCTKAGCLPDFITIGVQKGGTTSLYYYLQQYHTGLETSKSQELNFFSERYQNGLEWLRAEFPSKNPAILRGYKSPNYLPHPLVPFRLAATLGAQSVKLVLLLREPLSRAVSGWNMGRENGKERRALDAALASELQEVRHCLEVEVPKRKWPRVGCIWQKFFPTWHEPGGIKVDSWKGMTGPQGSYLLPGLYVLQLRHWLRAFELSQFHIMSSKAFAKDTKTQMQQLAQFLGNAQENGAESGKQPQRVNEKVLESRHRTKKDGGKGKKAAANSEAAVLSDATAAQLRAFFEPFNEELWVLLGRRIEW